MGHFHEIVLDLRCINLFGAVGEKENPWFGARGVSYAVHSLCGDLRGALFFLKAFECFL